MPRYIDADKVMEEINRIGGHNLCEWETIGVKALIDRQPTADVLPKSEVAEEIFAAIKVIGEIVTEHIESDNSLIEAEIDIVLYLSELKKKYTEESK